MQNTEYKASLEADLAEVIIELQTIATQNQETGDWEAVPIAEDLLSADENEEADAVEDWESKRAIVAQLETRYRNIKRALEKIEMGTYGICEISGEPIEPARLAANPAARTTIANRDRERELPL
jgi:RNA polymerase-binding transcription factor DksA